MAEERRQNIFVTLATDGITLQKRTYDLTVKYPLDEESVLFDDSIPPTNVFVALAGNAISFDECQEFMTRLATRFKNLGCKMHSDIDINYSLMQIEGNQGDDVLAQYVLQYIVKGS